MDNLSPTTAPSGKVSSKAFYLLSQRALKNIRPNNILLQSSKSQPYYPILPNKGDTDKETQRPETLTQGLGQ